MQPASIASAPELSDHDLSLIARIVYEQSGISLHLGKRALVAARLQKRLRKGGFRSFRQYVRYVQADDSGCELTAMLDAIATNHTAFFREPRHFEFLARTVLPRLAARGGPILGWSAACATGEEPYTIAMILLDRLGPLVHREVRLLASDLSTKALATAAAAAYNLSRLHDVPPAFCQRYFVRGPGDAPALALVAPPVRRLVEFRQMNLLHLNDSMPLQDFIFCRNVMIYFDQDVQQRVVDALERRLAPGGHLFVSHSESLSRIRHGLTWIAPSIYRRGPA
ncbi:MAG TPA: protein-glutamate O-methyltransferase CheR [Vicinamibacterales bacterium]|nr:protein-glutamate O-methyltransferase CheR [Vicinamibacterales bacterium]